MTRPKLNTNPMSNTVGLFIRKKEKIFTRKQSNWPAFFLLGPIK